MATAIITFHKLGGQESNQIPSAAIGKTTASFTSTAASASAAPLGTDYAIVKVDEEAFVAVSGTAATDNVSLHMNASISYALQCGPGTALSFIKV